MENYSTATTRVINSSAVATLFKSTYLQMGAALVITALTAFFLAGSQQFIELILTSRSVMWMAILAEFGVVIWLSSRLWHMSMSAATLLFILYSVLNGVTMSVIFMFYDPMAIAVTFFVTAGMFITMSLIGYVTRMDLSKLGSIFMMFLVGIIIASVVNIFVASGPLYWVITYLGVIVFVGLTAYDTNKLKHIYTEYGAADENGHKLALMGALTLYLDFVNLFLFLLRIFGNRR